MMEKEKSLAYWIYYENGHVYYCDKCIHDRVDEINKNHEFSDDINYEDGDDCGYYYDVADSDEEVFCSMCGKPLYSNFDNQ
jgi:hypothetical protein